MLTFQVPHCVTVSGMALPVSLARNATYSSSMTFTAIELLRFEAIHVADSEAASQGMPSPPALPRSSNTRS